MNGAESSISQRLPLCLLAAGVGLLVAGPGRAAEGLHAQDFSSPTHAVSTAVGLRPSVGTTGLAVPASYGTLSAFTQFESRLDFSRHPAIVSDSGLQQLRITRTGLRGSFGTLAIEQQWLASTLAPSAARFDPPHSLRLQHPTTSHTLSWTSPSRAGWSLGASYTRGLQPWQYGVATSNRLFGAVSYSRGGLTLSGASNGAQDWNLLGSYTEGRNTWRLTLSRFDGDDDPALQFGLDHRYSRALTFFAAFHHDDDGAEPAGLRPRSIGLDSGIRSGRGIMTGLRYDF